MDELKKLCDPYNGYITLQILLENNYTKYKVSKFVKTGVLSRIGRGKYVHKDYLPDELLIYQDGNNHFVYSNETALYLHNLTDRYPRELTVTTKQGYHLRNKDVKIYYVKEENYDLGITEMKDNSGNIIRVYDKERTICDIIKNKKRIDTQIYVQGIQNYFLNNKPDLRLLSKYARILNISDRVMGIVELYMKP